jgi:acyl transferase domain-containing protein
MLSTDYKCKTFDNSANGYVRSEGCAVIIVEKLSDAILNNKYIYGVVKGSAINHDGKTATLTAPNGPSQEKLYQMALTDSKLQPSDIDYIECHGTATPLGDPIETGSIMKIYGSNRIKPLYLGSVKSNIGHTEPVAGLAGIIKSCLIFKSNLIPATIHFKELNNHIKLEPNVYIVDKNIALNLNTKADFKIAVSSFGFSGTNAHVILSSYPNTKDDKIVVKNPINWNRKYYWISNNTLENSKLKKTIKL